MGATVVRADYDALTRIANKFEQEAGASGQMLRSLRGQMQTLQGGDWVGKGANAFYAEMSGELLPALQRLMRALEAAAQTTQRINQKMQQAEEEAACAPTLIFRLVPRAARDQADDAPVIGDATEDAAEAATLAQYESARTRLGLRC